MEGAATSSSDRTPSILLSTAEMIKFRDDQRTLTFTMVGGHTVAGFVRWFDSESIHIVTVDSGELTLLKTGILYYRAAA